MPEQLLDTRPAKDDDFEFAWELYSDAIRPMIEPKLAGAWEPSQERSQFQEIWNPSQSHIIQLDGETIGWGAVDEKDDSVEIQHLYLLEEHRGKGYGTKLLSELIDSWRSKGKSVTASVIKNSRPTSLVQRLGFSQSGGDSLVNEMVCK